MISFSSAALNSTRDLLAENKRDIQSPALISFYELDAGAQRDLAGRYQAVLESRANTALPLISAGRFASDSSPFGGPVFFSKVLQSSGIEALVSEDLVTRTVNTVAAPRLASFITKQARVTPLNQEALLSVLGAEAESTTKHLIVDDPSVVFDEDPVIYSRLRNTHRYLRSLIK